jgi:hypothetical protein
MPEPDLQRALEVNDLHKLITRHSKNGDSLLCTLAHGLEHVERLLSTTYIGGIPVTSHVHREPTTKGVIRGFHKPPTPYRLEEIQRELYQGYGVTRVEVVIQYRNGIPTPSNMVRLDFDLNLPSHVMIGEDQWKVSVYDPPIPQCGRCKRWDHLSDGCRNAWTCMNCAKGPHHVEAQCRAPTKCTTCTGAHSSRDKICSGYKK